MIAPIGALCAMLVFAGGYQAHTDMLAGLLLTAFGVIGLGTLVAYIQTMQTVTSLDSREGLSLHQFDTFINKNLPDINGDTKIYVGDSGLHPAGSVFACVMGGHRVVVVERLLEQTTTEDTYGPI